MLTAVTIISILVCMFFPRVIMLIEYSRATEALLNIGQIRQSIESCMAFEKSYRKCANFRKLDSGDPSNVINSHFIYEFTDVTRTGYKLIATRNIYEGGDGLSTIDFQQTKNQILRSGTGVFERIQ